LLISLAISTTIDNYFSSQDRKMLHTKIESLQKQVNTSITLQNRYNSLYLSTNFTQQVNNRILGNLLLSKGFTIHNNTITVIVDLNTSKELND
jgi:hypothetical protein